jgi:hypothetical protein
VIAPLDLVVWSSKRLKKSPESEHEIIVRIMAMKLLDEHLQRSKSAKIRLNDPTIIHHQ